MLLLSMSLHYFKQKNIPIEDGGTQSKILSEMKQLKIHFAFLMTKNRPKQFWNNCELGGII